MSKRILALCVPYTHLQRKYLSLFALSNCFDGFSFNHLVFFFLFQFFSFFFCPVCYFSWVWSRCHLVSDWPVEMWQKFKCFGNFWIFLKLFGLDPLRDTFTSTYAFAKTKNKIPNGKRGEGKGREGSLEYIFWLIRRQNSNKLFIWTHKMTKTEIPKIQ